MLDEDGRPVRGAGAMPYQGFSGGVGDKTGVAFSTNWMERAPTQNPKGKFMTDFAKMIADVAAGKTQPADVGDMPAGQPAQKETRSQRMKRMWAERKAAGLNRLGGRESIAPMNEREDNAFAEGYRKQKEKFNGRAVAVSEPALPKRTRRAQTGSTAIQGYDQGPSVSSDGLSNVSRFGSGGGAGLPEAQPSTEAGGPDLQSRLAAVGLTPDKIPIAIQAAAQIGLQPFHINPGMFAQIPLESALHQLDRLRAQTAALSQMLEDRRQHEQPEDLSKCIWCGTIYPNGRFFTRQAFEIPTGSGQWRSAHSCNNAVCLGKNDMLIARLWAQIRAERAG